MPRTAVNAITAPGPYAAAPQALTWSALDNTNGNKVVCANGDLIIVRSTIVGPVSVTLNSSADRQGRTKNIVQSVAQNAYYVFGPINLDGWIQSDGSVWLDASITGAEFMVLRPA